MVCASTETVPGTGKLHASYAHVTSSMPCPQGQKNPSASRNAVVPRMPASAVVTSNAPASAASMMPPGRPRASILPICLHETADAMALLMLMLSIDVPKRGSSALASTATSCAVSCDTPAAAQTRQPPCNPQAHCCFCKKLMRSNTGASACLHLLKPLSACEQRLDRQWQAKRDPWQSAHTLHL